jgi:hypothetical protein
MKRKRSTTGIHKKRGPGCNEKGKHYKLLTGFPFQGQFLLFYETYPCEEAGQQISEHSSNVEGQETGDRYEKFWRNDEIGINHLDVYGKSE